MIFKKFRHFLIRLLDSTIYNDWITYNSFPRGTIEFAREKFGNKLLSGVEIGAGEGSNAESILETLNMKILFLIDPYEPYIDDGQLINTYDNILPLTKERLSKFVEKIKFLLKKSNMAITDIPNDLDFVYIDGCHTYEFVKRDIALYYPKVRKGGIFGGHDYPMFGVQKAVNELVKEKDLKLHLKEPDWWVEKKLEIENND